MSESKEMNLAQLEATMEEFFVTKAPFQIPTEAREAIVKYGPWVMLVLMILSLPALIALLGLSTLFTTLAVASGKSMFSVIPGIISLISLVVNAMALPGLFKRSKQGWQYAYYAQWLSVIASVVSLSVVSALVSGLIGFYILFQIKHLYK